MTSIRPSRPADVDRLFQVWKAAVDATHDFLSEADRVEIARTVREDYLPGAGLWVAVDAADIPVGFMGLTGAHIDAIFIHPAAHGRGIGRSFVQHAAAAHGRLTVDVNAQNGGARAFYERLGFHETGRSAHDDAGRPYPLLHLERP